MWILHIQDNTPRDTPKETWLLEVIKQADEITIKLLERIKITNADTVRQKRKDSE